MTSIIKLQPISGVHGESPPCYVLQVDEFRFLLDCGWDEEFNMVYMDTLKKHLPQIDAMLLSYPDPLHLGALPYLVGKANLSCPIYATVPVYKMGQMFMYDLYQSRHNTEAFDIFSLDDVDSAFDKIHQLKYSQTVSLKGKGQGLQITPIPAGHMIGGTIWKILKDGEEEIIYAVDFNHKKERHLNGCIFEGINRPHLLITDAFNADYTHARRRLRDEQLLTSIIQAMRNDGNVLVAVDTAGRVLELAHLLDQMWRTQEAGLMTYSLVLLNNVSYNVVEFAKSQVEWMSEKIMRAFEDRRNNPFQFKHLQLCHSLAELAKVPDPKVVLVSTPDLQSGFSRDLFVQWCTNPKNTIVLTNRTSPGTLARWLIDNPEQRHITLEVRRRVRLEGVELDEHLKREKEKKLQIKLNKQKSDSANKESSELAMSSESEAESDDESAGGGGTAGGVGAGGGAGGAGGSGGGGGTTAPSSGSSSKTKHDLMMKSEGKSRTGFFKQAKKAYPMFPFTEEKMKWDDYGEIIRAEDYFISETTATEEVPMDTNKNTNKNTTKPEEPAVEEKVEIPTKCVKSIESFDILANVMFIDFEGRSDGESIRKILAQIKPRQLIVVRGTEPATTSLAEYCRNTRDLVQGTVFTPRLNELVDATRESHIYQVRLKDSVVSALKFSKAREAEIAWIDGQLDLTLGKTDTSVLEDHDEQSGDVDMKDDTVGGIDIPTLVPLVSATVTTHVSVFINEPKLSDFKQVLTKEGLVAEFSGGVLVCNNLVAIRRTEAGRLQLEGCLCDEYYKVRELLMGQFAIV